MPTQLTKPYQLPDEEQQPTLGAWCVPTICTRGLQKKSLGQIISTWVLTHTVKSHSACVKGAVQISVTINGNLHQIQLKIYVSFLNYFI